MTTEMKNSGTAVQNEERDGVAIGIIGSRRRDRPADYRQCLMTLRRIGIGQDDIIVSGGCTRGGDRFAEIIARKYGIPIVIHAANWQEHGRSAGLIRNGDIARDADILVAVVAPDRTGGTEDTIRKFARLGKTNLVLVPPPDDELVLAYFLGGEQMSTDKIDGMYLVGCYGGYINCHAELFSSKKGGEAEVVYVYKSANAQVRDAAKKYAARHSIPLIIEKRTKVCPVCKEEYDLAIQEPRDGRLIQDQFPNATKTEREQLISGICSDKCWHKLIDTEPPGGEA